MTTYDNTTLAAKALQIAQDEGFDSSLEYAEENIYDSVSMGICLRPDCNFTTEVEPDCHDGFCDLCGSSSVTSFVELFMLTAV